MGMAYGVKLTGLDRDSLEAASVLAQQRLPMDGTEVGVLFRVEAVRYAGCTLTEYDTEDYYVTDARLEVFPFAVQRFTEHGATLCYTELAGGRHKWVDLRKDAKQWASRSVTDAVAQFADRRKRQIYILNRQLARAQAELALTQPHPLAKLLPVIGGS